MRLVEHVIEFVPGRQARTTRRTRPDDWHLTDTFQAGRSFLPSRLSSSSRRLAVSQPLAARAQALQLRVAAFNNLKFLPRRGRRAARMHGPRGSQRLGGLIKVEGRVTADGTLVAAGGVTLAEAPDGAP